MTITLTIIGGMLAIFLIGTRRLAYKFKREVRILFSHSSNISKNIFQFKEIETLPEPVQRYFKFVMKDGQPFISYARLKHDGKFKTGLKNPWVNITGEEYFATQRPGFIWKGTTSFFVARDMFIRNKGHLVVSLLSFYKIVDAKGDQYNQGELLRWLGESVWFPTNFLPTEYLNWEAIDANSAKLNFTYHDIKLYFWVTFNTLGEITQMETKRFMNKESLETWIIDVSNYKKMNEIMIPTTAEVMWRLKDGDHCYAKFRVTALEYGIPAMFNQ